MIQTTAAISPGSSGGGLFDDEGRLVGLTTFYLDSGQSLNFAIPVEWIGDVKPGRKQASEEHSKSEWMKRAIALEEKKDWLGMLDWCQKWTKSEPNNANAWYGLGIAYGWLKRYDDAVEALRQAIRINPEHALAWYILGATYAHSGNKTAAMNAVQELRRLDPERADKLFNLIVPH